MRLKSSSQGKRERLLKEFETCAFPLTNRIYGTAFMMTRDKLDAEDLVQNTFRKAWQYFDTFELGTNFEGWIFRILTNNYINQYRKEKRASQRADFETVSAIVPAEQTSESEDGGEPDVVENYHEVFDDPITVALDKLPEFYRIVVLLADVAELKYKEIAEMLDCPIGTVMSRLNRGRKTLAKNLEAYADANGYLADSR